MTAKISSATVSTPANATRSAQKPPALMVPFMKMPLVLYRLGLGWMLGKRFMLLKHVGRKSGKTYHTVLAILRFEAETKEMMAVSPWSGSNWYRNIQETPALEVETGNGLFRRVRYVPVQRSLSAEEIAQLFIAFRQQYPIFSRMIARIPGWKINSTYEEFLTLAKTLRGVAFRPAQD